MNIVLSRLARILMLACALASSSVAQSPASQTPMLATDAVSPARFVAAHGRRALLMGYSGFGLEAWAYPFQLFTHYRLQFLLPGTGTAIEANSILRRIEYRPDSVTRIYAGEGFVVREQLFVPLDRPGVILSCQVEGSRAVDLRVTFLPVLNLMWPGAIGGQDLHWSEALSGYAISQATTGVRAVIASPQAIEHTPVVNATLRQDLTETMVLHPSHGVAEVYAALEEQSAPEGSTLRELEQQESALRAAWQAHIESVLASGIRIHTPDDDLNRAIAWSRLALDAAWACNARIGCGELAGYGPSRPERRPQYAWFFAGDGLEATEAMLATGDAERAREELEFVLKYQNPANGMIWHEISQSAGYIDWAGKYPYLYVHVDISFQFLSTLADYYEQTGDLDFLRRHWDQIAAAYRYCRSLVNPATALPQIPAGKEGGNEQDRMSEDVSLSAAWVSASAAWRELALAAGHQHEAAAAALPADAARKALSARYWNPQTRFWIAGYTASGKPMNDERSHPDLLGLGLFPPEQEDAALDQLASADFETDWGTRSISARSPHYDANSYGGGSVWALLTSDMAQAFWRVHRPAIAWPIFHSLLPWLQLDSLGHMHEVLAGDFYHPQVESVPEQTWSSAGFLGAAIHGLLGIRVDAAQHKLTLAPHLDPRWAEVSLAQIAVGGARIGATLDQKQGEFDAVLTAQGGPVHIAFAPQIPLGATGVRAFVEGRRIAVAEERNAEEEQARVEIDLAGAPVHCRIVYSGGVRLSVPTRAPVIGQSSRQLRLTAMHLEARQLSLDADIANPDDASVDLETTWPLGAVEGGTVLPLGGGWYRLTFADAVAQAQSVYTQHHLTLQLGTK